MALKEEIYYKSPIFIQNILTSMYGKKLMQERYGSGYERKLQELRVKDRTVDYRTEQLERLNTFLLFTQAHTPYYRKLFQEHDIRLPFTSLEQLQTIPILEKETLRQQNEAFMSEVDAPVRGRTGGTSGKSLQVAFMREDVQERMAHLDYFKELHGFHGGMRRASFTGRTLTAIDQKKPIFWRMNRPLNQLLLSIFHMKEENFPAYIEELNRFRPVALDGTPTAMLEIALYLLKHKLRLNFSLVAIFPTSETVTPEMRRVLEEAFRAPVFDQYGSSEGAPIISECREHKLHLHHETGIIEPYGDRGEVVVTCFTTRGTPLVRYRIGDRMTLGQDACTCGLNGPVIESIDGRGTSYIVSEKRGKVFEGDITTIARELPNSVLRLQVEQHALNHVTLRYIPDEQRFVPKHEKILLREMQKLLGSSMHVTLEPVQQMKQEPNGKTLIVKQSMK
ncbi:phenylacetate--CoA ligase family protein [Exiguobacterium sp. 17-1]|uniref:phenylacetate--CoA ligase family protein n=1 Tax=Exiguobacterium sp. 17-1 TaxID=2931981 RepID=UPI001FFF544B|nr:phenylacetate--CoA ligase family protein [Exiguobacterium sp. 17-1]MCK2156222.1 phenylacetate--CoA ligase family protein [Exiguobacterium sp. 17-1]